jgi:hypothetical protein
MAAAVQAIDTYRKLADYHHNHGQPQHRDRFLVLAADSAFADGRTDEAETLRQRLLRYNPHHLLKPFSSFGQALKSPDVQTYLSDLRRSYPVHLAADLLASLPGKADNNTPRSSKVLPPTQPVIDLGTPFDGADAVGIETLKVYPVKREPDEPKPLLRPKTAIGPGSIPIRRPTPSRPPVADLPQRPRPAQPQAYRLQPAGDFPEPIQRTGNRGSGLSNSGSEEGNSASAAICLALAALVAAASLALAAYSLIAPVLGRPV